MNANCLMNSTYILILHPELAYAHQSCIMCLFGTSKMNKKLEEENQKTKNKENQNQKLRKTKNVLRDMFEGPAPPPQSQITLYAYC